MNRFFLPARPSRDRPRLEEHPARVLRRVFALVAALLLLGTVSPREARAQTSDPPARVGRIAFVSGTVSFHANGQDQWTAAALNYPLSVGDAVWTEPGAHAVVEIGPAAYRLDGGTELDAIQIDQHVAHLRVSQGSVNLRLGILPPGDSYLIDTPRGTVALREAGLFRIDAGTADRPTHIVAFRGAAEFDGPGSNFVVQPGQAVDVSGDQTLVYDARPADQTPLDRWAAARDAGPVVAAAPRYVSPQETGYQDLDHYGSWATTPDYGTVWYPTVVPVGWAPYRYGHWAWIPPWGWTWIDDAPWGFTPFHYGRWIVIHERWAWVPGAVVVEPVYAPALVAFIGGSGWSVRIAAGAVPAVGWVPLAPHEVFVPVYHASPTYITRVNVTNVNVVEINKVVNVTNVTQVNKPITFVNQRAVTVVAHRDFVAARPISKVALHADPAVLKTASVLSRRDPAALPKPTSAVATAPAGQIAPRPKPVSLPTTPQPAGPKHMPPARTAQPHPVPPTPEHHATQPPRERHLSSPQNHPAPPVAAQPQVQPAPPAAAPIPPARPKVVEVPRHPQPQPRQVEPRREIHVPLPEHKPQRVTPPTQREVHAPPPHPHPAPHVQPHPAQQVQPPHPVPQAQQHPPQKAQPGARGEQHKEEHGQKDRPSQ